MGILRGLFYLVCETTTEQLRSKILLPSLAVSVGFIYLANLVSEWGIAEFERILFDVGVAGYHFVGVFMAIVWGISGVSEARKNGSVETRLSSPIPRWLWFLGRYLGLVVSLLMASFLFLFIWQLAMLGYDFGWLGTKVVVFFSQTLCWCVLGAFSMFWATFCGYPTAGFLSLVVWFLGLVMAGLSRHMPDDIDKASRVVVESLSYLWDLQRFQWTWFIDFPERLTNQMVLTTCIYGVSWIFLLVTLGCLVFSKRDFY